MCGTVHGCAPTHTSYGSTPLRKTDLPLNFATAALPRLPHHGRRLVLARRFAFTCFLMPYIGRPDVRAERPEGALFRSALHLLSSP